MWQICDAKQKADGIQNIRLSTAVQTGDGIEQWIKPNNLCPLCIGLESINDHGLDVHFAFMVLWIMQF